MHLQDVTVIFIFTDICDTFLYSRSSWSLIEPDRRFYIFLWAPADQSAMGSLGSLFIGFSTGRVPFTLPYLLCLSISMNDYSTYILLTL